MKPEDFINQLIGPAQECMRETGIPASFTIAQAALESAWGCSKLYLQASNLFGVKADESWQGKTVVMETSEYEHGKEIKVDAEWRKYSDLKECLDDHAKFLTTNPRYAPAFIHKCGGDQFAHYIAAGGYATDPLYAQKIHQIIYSHNLLAIDEEGET